MIEIARIQFGWTWIARVLALPFGAHRRRRLPHIDGLSDHMRRDIGLDGL